MLHFDVNALEPGIRLTEISQVPIPYKRPRIAGKNARLDTHGWGGEVPIARIKAGGIEGFGWCPLPRHQADRFLGVSLSAMFKEDGMLRNEYKPLEFALLDWLGNWLHKPVYELAALNPDKIKNGFSAPCYDTTIYFDELYIKDDKAAVNFILDEVKQGLARNFRNFKIKIGRCGMWMELHEGLRRDIDIVNGIRGLAGKDAKLMVDANNGYNLNIAKEFLLATKEANVYWLEEAFHEDSSLYSNLKTWMKGNGINTLIADGEGDASPRLIDWAKKGLIDVVQYDLRGYGFFNWMELSKELAPYKTLCAAHNYGGFYGNYAQGHFAACTDYFAFCEFDIAEAEGIDTSLYSISKNGDLLVPKADGFGLVLDKNIFEKYRDEKGYKITL